MNLAWPAGASGRLFLMLATKTTSLFLNITLLVEPQYVAWKLWRNFCKGIVVIIYLFLPKGFWCTGTLAVWPLELFCPFVSFCLILQMFRKFKEPSILASGHVMPPVDKLRLTHDLVRKIYSNPVIPQKKHISSHCYSRMLLSYMSILSIFWRCCRRNRTCSNRQQGYHMIQILRRICKYSEVHRLIRST